MPRVLTARFMHETNTFSRVKTDMALIRRRDFHLENEIPQAFRGTRSALGATFEAADKYGWTLVHPVSANPNPSGIVTDDAFEQIAGMILEAADTKGPVDGALLQSAPPLPPGQLSIDDWVFLSVTELPALHHQKEHPQTNRDPYPRGNAAEPALLT